MTLRAIILELLHDRVIQATSGTSAVSLMGAAGMEKHPITFAAILADIQPWVAFFATLFGGLSAAAAFVYACLKIHRMLKAPSARE